MLKEILTMAIRGAIKGLAINPRDIRIDAVIDESSTTLAKIDAQTIGELLNVAAEKRALRLKVGAISYDIDLGSKTGTTRKHRGTPPAQNRDGDDGEA